VSAPYYEDESVTLHLGDSTELTCDLMCDNIRVDAVVTDPPYGETSLDWDSWPEGWPAVMKQVALSMWVFGSMRMFLDRRDEFAGWKLSQDLVWEKHNGSGFHADRFRRVHEHAAHWYRGDWADVYKDPQTTNDATARTRRSKRRPTHTGHIDQTPYVSIDGGPRLMTSVLYAPSMHGRAIHPTEKPVSILEPLIRYSCPPGGLVYDPFAGSGSTLVAARAAGRRAVGVEAREDYCEAIVRRLAQGDLFGGVA
jgi:site-specific DNA-methyltransferase (adenine-specific)